MKRTAQTLIIVAALGLSPVVAQEKKEMPMKGEGMQHGGMDMSQMKEMCGRMMEMKKGSAGMMGDMSGMRQHMSGKMTQEEVAEMSKMMGNMSAMMKHMSERMGRGMELTK